MLKMSIITLHVLSQPVSKTRIAFLIELAENCPMSSQCGCQFRNWFLT